MPYKDKQKLKDWQEAICGSIDRLRRHHWRYDKPLLVNTLCFDCHQIQHTKNFYESKYAKEDNLLLGAKNF